MLKRIKTTRPFLQQWPLFCFACVFFFLSRVAAAGTKNHRASASAWRVFAATFFLMRRARTRPNHTGRFGAVHFFPRASVMVEASATRATRSYTQTLEWHAKGAGKDAGRLRHGRAHGGRLDRRRRVQDGQGEKLGAGGRRSRRAVGKKVHGEAGLAQ